MPCRMRRLVAQHAGIGPFHALRHVRRPVLCRPLCRRLPQPRAAAVDPPAAAGCPAASASASPGGTSSPVSPSTTVSASPPVFDATSGLPATIASSATIPNGSAHTDGASAIVQRRHASITAACGIRPSAITPGGSSSAVPPNLLPITTRGGTPTGSSPSAPAAWCTPPAARAPPCRPTGRPQRAGSRPPAAAPVRGEAGWTPACSSSASSFSGSRFGMTWYGSPYSSSRLPSATALLTGKKRSTARRSQALMARLPK